MTAQSLDQEDEVKKGEDHMDEQSTEINDNPETEPRTEQETEEEKKEWNAKAKKRGYPVTIEDVRDALTDEKGNRTSAFTTNAGTIRDKIGRGSLTTIQKRLKQIREDDAKLTLPLKTETPPPPTGVVDVLWQAAWESAQSILLQRCNDLSTDKDRISRDCEVIKNDMLPLLEEIGDLEKELSEKEGKIHSLNQANETLKVKHANEMAEVHGQLAESRTQIKILTELIEKNINHEK